MEKTTQWRFTPPTHVVVALDAALDQFVAQGGRAARHARYRRELHDARRGHGEARASAVSRPLDPGADHRHVPRARRIRRYSFTEFYNRVRDKGFILYPGKLTQVETFRVGCIGAIGPEEMRHAVNAVRDTLAEMGVTATAPAAVRRAAA